MNNETLEIKAGDVRVFTHTDNELTEDVQKAIEYWKNTLKVFGFVNTSDFDIHIWDMEDFVHFEIGNRVYHKRNFDGVVSRAIFIMDLIKVSNKGMMIVEGQSSPWHDDITAFAKDTASLLKDKFGWSEFNYMDMDEFEAKFFHFEPMMLDEKGRRIARSGIVLLEEGYRTFGLTNKAMVDMLL